MIVATRTYSPVLVSSIVTDDGLWPNVTEDGMELTEFLPDVDGDCWLLIQNIDATDKSRDIQTIGVYNLHPLSSTTLQVHAQVLPQHRKIYARDSALATLKWFVDNAPENYQKVIAFIPTLYSNVFMFATKLGFKNEGLTKNAYLKNDQLHDMWLVGISRREIELKCLK